jgi:hypothetical protein
MYRNLPQKRTLLSTVSLQSCTLSLPWVLLVYSSLSPTTTTTTTRSESQCGLAILHFKSILRQKKKNYGSSNISPYKNIPNLQKKPS